jgi:hypothetical protein
MAGAAGHDIGDASGGDDGSGVLAIVVMVVLLGAAVAGATAMRWRQGSADEEVS